MGTPADSAIARQRLLEAACDVFAEYGYQHATVRMICAEAKLNPGAINYHFGSKRELYAEVLRLARPGIEPPLDGKPESTSKESQLRSFIAFFLADTLDWEEPPWRARVLANELANPSDLLDDLVREAVQPHFERLRGIIASLLGPGVDDQTVDDHAFGVVSQVIFYQHSRPVIERVAGRRYGQEDMERLTNHVLDSALAALESERRGLQRHGIAPAPAEARR